VWDDYLFQERRTGAECVTQSPQGITRRIENGKLVKRKWFVSWGVGLSRNRSGVVAVSLANPVVLIVHVIFGVRTVATTDHEHSRHVIHRDGVCIASVGYLVD